ncbi:DUF2971 domain-containing protein [Limimaricola sp. AA108-03]|uniref:DUF2971 domain-containing protein n=1 Tax=Limimaricola sp. AA108-03 TaxID=3425945 RepID=UPI003D76A801
MYQYSSLDGVESILRSRTLWLSDLAASNDPRELELGYEQVVEALKSVRHTEYAGERGLFLSLLAGRLAGFRSNINVFTACFTPLRDSLPMWREYGAGGSGCAIGFRPAAIADMPGRLQRVSYLEGNAQHEVRSTVLAIANTFAGSGGYHDNIFWIEATAYAAARITQTKHASWAYEKELRLCYSQPKKAPGASDQEIASWAYPDGMEGYWQKPMIRERGCEEISYVPFHFGKRRNGVHSHQRAVSEIILGPASKASIADITKMISELGYVDVKVSRSDCLVR